MMGELQLVATSPLLPLANDRQAPPPPSPNLLIAKLPPNLRRTLQRASRLRTFKTREVVSEPFTPMRAALFPRSGLLSLVGTSNGELQVEIASVGNEGMIGLCLFFGMPSLRYSVIALSPCEVDEVDAEAFRLLMEERREFRDAMAHYADERMEQVIRLSICNARHQLEHRLARWILSAHARLGADPIPITHWDLSRLLGVRRASVTEALHLLEGERAIWSRRGTVSVRDLEVLRRLSCDCHDLAHEQVPEAKLG